MGSQRVGHDWATELNWTEYSNVCGTPPYPDTHLLYPLIFFISLIIDGHLSCFHILFTINNSVINMEVNTSFWANVFVFFREILGSRSARSHDSSHLHILRNLHIVFLSGCTNFHSDQQCTRVPFAPHPYKHLLFIAILTGEGNGTLLQYSCLENPWTEEPGMLQSMRSLRVGHDWVTSLSLFTFMHWRRKRLPTPVFLPGESQGRGSLVGCRLWGRTELDTTEAT